MNNDTIKNNKKDSVNHGDCPSKEDLSNWYDNGDDTQIKDHLDICRPCEQTVSFYQRVDETVCLAGAPPKYLAGDIAEACRNIQHETLHMPLWMRVVRIAAVVAVICTVAGVIHLVTQPETDSGHPLIADTPEQPGLNTAMDLPNLPRVQIEGLFSGTPSLLNHSPDNHQIGPVRQNDLVTVSASGNNNQSAINSRHRRGRVAENVRHVWAVKDVEASRDVLLQTLPQQAKQEVFPKVSEEMLIFEVAMTDAQLQQYVNDLQSKGWALVTKDLPQPGQEESVQLTGQPVKYHVELVEKEN